MGNATRLLTVGTYTADIILHGIRHIAAPGEVVYLEEPPSMEPGGHAVNVSIDYRRLTGERVVSVGAVGRDWFGEFLTRSQQAEGVEPRVEVHGDVGTARNIIIVVRGEDRRFHVYRGANRRLSPGFVGEALHEAGSGLLYLAAGFSPPLDRGLGKLVEELGDMVLYADPAYTSTDSVKALEPVLGRAHYIHVNRAELAMLTGSEDLAEALRLLSPRTSATMLVTSGEGVVAYSPRESRALHMPSFKVEARDPTGAGDAFSAGFLAWLSEKGLPGDWDSLAEALLYAQASGAAAVTEAGATRGVRRERVEEIIRRQGEAVLQGARIVEY